MESPESQAEKLDRDVFVVVLGSGLFERKGRIEPSEDERARIIAGLRVVERERAKHLVFTGGDVYRVGKSISGFSEDYARRMDFKKVLPEDIREIPAKNTQEEFEKIDDLRQALPPDARIIVVSGKNHIVAQKFAKEHGFEFEAAEEVLKRSYRSGYLLQKLEDAMNSEAYTNILKSQIQRANRLDTKIGRLAYKPASDVTLPFRARIRPWSSLTQNNSEKPNQ